jgi:hypothetical protein
MLAAAHQGEEFVILLPIVMMGAAYFLLRWANQGPDESALEPPIEPPDEAEAAHHP